MKYFKTILTVILFFSLFSIAYAQPAPPATPIDGGLSLLLAGGAAYGLRKIYNKKNQ